jgi:uncharacterized ion transporter superfamily protein YfcC
MSENLNNKKKFQMPSALMIVTIFLMIVGLLTWFVPTSVVVDGEIIYNAAFDADGNVIENAGTSPVGLWNLFLAPILGLQEGVQVAAALIVSGGFVAVLTATGALDAGIGALLRKFSGNTLICVLMFAFALMGTVFGLWEELPAYAVVVIPMFLAAGYDAFTGIMVIIVGAVAGNMADIVNPYAIGAAVAATGNDELGIGDGIVLRMILFVVLLAMGCFFVTRYASSVKKDPSKSVVDNKESASLHAHFDVEEIKPLTGKHKASLAIFIFVILFTIVGYAPWDSIGDGETVFNAVNSVKNLSGSFFGNLLGVDSFCELGWWYFDEFCALWLLGAVLIGIVNKMPEKVFVKTFAAGAADLMSVILVLSISRGIGVFMGDKYSGMSITFIYWLQDLLTGVPLWAFVVAAIAVYLMIALFLQSTSGVAGITMPIFGAIALALFSSTAAGGIAGQVLLISAFTCGVNFICGIYPEATNMAMCEMTGTSYPTYLKTMLKTLVPMLVVAAIIISVAPYVGLV